LNVIFHVVLDKPLSIKVIEYNLLKVILLVTLFPLINIFPDSGFTEYHLFKT